MKNSSSIDLIDIEKLDKNKVGLIMSLIIS